MPVEVGMGKWKCHKNARRLPQSVQFIVQFVVVKEFPPVAHKTSTIIFVCLLKLPNAMFLKLHISEQNKSYERVANVHKSYRVMIKISGESLSPALWVGYVCASDNGDLLIWVMTGCLCDIEYLCNLDNMVSFSVLWVQLLSP